MRVDITRDGCGSILIRTLEPITFCIEGQTHTIAPGYISDGASVPFILWGVISPPVDPRTLVPSIKHDWLYETHLVTRRVADRYYRDDLVRNRFPVFLSYAVWIGVRSGGWLYW